MSNLKTLVFGDSFVNFLSLIKTFKIKKFSGKTLKGITKKDSPIFKIMSKMTKSYRTNDIVFGFGNVDLHISFYYDLFTKPEYTSLDINERVKLWENNTKNVIEEYIKKLKKLNIRGKTVHIFQVFPSTLLDKNVSSSLKKYIQFDSETLDKKEKKIFKSLIKKTMRDERYQFFNKRLSIEARKHGFKFLDIEKYILNEKSRKIKKPLIDISELNIHLLWEPMLLKLVKHNQLNKLGITKENTKDLEAGYKKYLDFKEKILEEIDPLDKDYVTKKRRFLENYKK